MLVVKEDSLEDVIFEWLLVVQLVLEVGAIETHFLRSELIERVTRQSIMLTSFRASAGTCLIMYIGWNDSLPFLNLAESSLRPTVEIAWSSSKSIV